MPGIQKDIVLDKILSHLTVKQISRLTSVSKQFQNVIDKRLSTVSVIRVLFTNNRKANPLSDDNTIDLCFKGKLVFKPKKGPESHFDVKKFMKKYSTIAKKLKGLKKIVLILFCVNPQLFKWINEMFPEIPIYLKIIKPNSWTLEEFKLVELSFASKVFAINIRYLLRDATEKIRLTKLLEAENLVKLIILTSAGDSAEAMLPYSLRWSETITHFVFKTTFLSSGLRHRKLNDVLMRNGTNLKVLRVHIHEEARDQELFDFITIFCPSLKELRFCHSNHLESFGSVKYLRQLNHLSIKSTPGRLYGVPHYLFMSTGFNSSIRILKIKESVILSPYSMVGFNQKYPNIQTFLVTIQRINCNEGSDDECVDCYQRFFRYFSRELDQKTNKWRNFTIVLNCGVRSRTIRDILLKDFLESENSYDLNLSEYSFTDFIEAIVHLIGTYSRIIREESHQMIVVKVIDDEVLESIKSLNHLLPNNLILVDMNSIFWSKIRHYYSPRDHHFIDIVTTDGQHIHLIAEPNPKCLEIKFS